MNVNCVVIGGNLTRDPELTYTPQGTAVADFTVAVNEKWKDKATGEMREQATFIAVKAWGKTAEFVAEQFRKGSPVLVEGKITQETWQTAEGQKREKTRVRADKVHVVEWLTPKDGQQRGGKKEPLVIPDDQGQNEQFGGEL